jgi:hypothetical protein
MMNRLLFGFLCLVGVVAIPTIAAAAPVGQRLNNQQERIYNGVSNGSLTPREYQRLERRDDAITAQYYRDRRDGHGLTAAERWRLQHRLNQQSRSIYRNKHD